jgi:phage baseplate assembly protein W
MTDRPRNRAWHFAWPGTEAGGGGLTIANRGEVLMVDGDRSIHQAILLLLATTPGERVMRPEYGCNLQRVAFMPNDETTAGLAIHHVRRALTRFERRIDVLAVDAINRHDPGECLEVRIDYRVRATRRNGSVALISPLAGGAAL